MIFVLASDDCNLDENEHKYDFSVVSPCYRVVQRSVLDPTIRSSLPLKCCLLIHCEKRTLWSTLLLKVSVMNIPFSDPEDVLHKLRYLH